MDAVDSDLIGKRLRRWRDEHDWSGPEAAGHASTPDEPLSWDDLRSFESGEAAPSDGVASALAKAYGRSLDDLTGAPGTDDMPPESLLAADDRPDHIRERSPYRPGAQADHSVTVGAWHLHPNDTIERSELHKRYGGSGRSGISPCQQTNNVLVFSDPEATSAHEYYDHWQDDGEIFLYCGEGLKGDQTLTKGNRAIMEHKKNRRSLRVFEGTEGLVRYAGRFEVASATPYVRRQIHDPDTGEMRRILVFRLVPFAG